MSKFFGNSQTKMLCAIPEKRRKNLSGALAHLSEKWPLRRFEKINFPDCSRNALPAVFSFRQTPA